MFYLLAGLVGLFFYLTVHAQAQDGIVETLSGAPTPGIGRFADAIARSEGFYVSGSVPQRIHNPGDLSRGDFGDTGIYHREPGGEELIVFESDQAGWSALWRKLLNILQGTSHVYSPSMTIYQMAVKWTLNDRESWAENVASNLGVTPRAPIGGLLQ